MYAESYSVTDRPSRRPPQSVRFFASPTFSWMGFEVGSNMMWSTDDQFAAQTLNRYYLNPRWSWGQVHAGDYSPMISRLTASAVRVRGGGFELSPGRFRIAASGGLAQDATDASAFDAAPRRMMYSGLLGYGDPARSFIEISALRAVDDSNGTDTLSVAPQENVVGTMAGGLAIGRVRVKGELGASLFSRDIRASEIDSLSQPAITHGVFTPRLSSRWDLAYLTEAQFGFRSGSIGMQYEEVGPGFTTLGNPYLPNDKREVRAIGSYRLLRGRLAASAALGRRSDNLAGDKRGTTTRQTGAFNLTVLTGNWLVSSANLLLNGLTRAPLPLPPGTPDPGLVDSFRIRNVTQSLSLVEQLRFTTGALPQSVSFSLSAQRIDDSSPRFGDVLDAAATSILLDWSATLAQQFIVSLRPGYDHFGAEGRDDSFTSLGLGLARRAPRSRWSAGTLTTFTQVAGGSQWRANANAGVRLTSRDQVAFNVRYARLQGVALPFTETLTSLRLTRRW